MNFTQEYFLKSVTNPFFVKHLLWYQIEAEIKLYNHENSARHKSGLSRSNGQIKAEIYNPSFEMTGFDYAPPNWHGVHSKYLS